MRLMMLSGVLTACETVLPMFTDSIPRGLFVGLNMIIIPAALIARVTTQKGFD